MNRIDYKLTKLRVDLYRNLENRAWERVNLPKIELQTACIPLSLKGLTQQVDNQQLVNFPRFTKAAKPSNSIPPKSSHFFPINLLSASPPCILFLSKMGEKVSWPCHCPWETHIERRLFTVSFYCFAKHAHPWQTIQACCVSKLA